MNSQFSRLWPRVEPILDAVLELPEPLRSARARDLCSGDPELGPVLVALLRADEVTGVFLATPPPLDFDLDETLAGEPPVSPDLDRVGPFRIVRELGRGGMGTVLLGERDDGQFDQRVAIKILQAGLPEGSARETLVRERRILARLEHPRIARMYDGGVTPAGDPYFVMEYVDGLPLDAFCETRRLPVRERLSLFREVCRAVEFAHGRFVVHCDLKPRNILVTSDGEVKLLDFGIARLAEEERAGERRSGWRFFTPAWAAPEQERGDAVTVATDVYQLGLVLRSLLAGNASPRDLDAIVAKALRPQPSERYPTAEALRRDLEDFLGGRPVPAFGGSTGYRAGKYVSRHRYSVAAAAAIAVSLVGGLVGVTAQSRVAARERDRATSAESRANAVNDFVLHELLQAPMPEVAMGRVPTVAEVLGNAARSVEHAFRGQPATEAEVRLTLAHTYAALGRTGDATTHAAAARTLLAGVPGRAPGLFRQAERTLAGLAIDEGRLDDARSALESLLEQERATIGPSDPETLETAAELGRALRLAGEFARAEALLRDASERVRSEIPSAWRLQVTIDSLLAETLLPQSRGVEAEAIARSVLDTIDRHLGPEHPERIRALLLQANALTSLLRYAEAGSATERALDLSRVVFGNDHTATADALTRHALAQERLGRYDAARSAVAESLRIRESALGDAHPRTVLSRYQLGVLAANAGRPDEAVPMFRDVVERRAATLGEAHPDTLRAMRSLVLALGTLGRREEAAAVVERMTRVYEKATSAPDADPDPIEQFAVHLLEFPPRDAARALALAERAVVATERRRPAILRTLADAQAATGRPDLAIATMREALALPDGLRSWSTTEELVRLLRATGRTAEIGPFLRDHRARQLAAPSPDERMVAKTERLIALELQRASLHRDAEAQFAEAAARLKRVVPPGNWEIGRLLSEWGGCLASRNAFAEAEPLLLEGEADLANDRNARELAQEARDRLVRLYEAWGRPAEAARWRTQRFPSTE